MTWPTILNASSVQRAWNDAVYSSNGLVVNCYADNDYVSYGTLQKVLNHRRKGKASKAKPLKLNLGAVSYRVRVWPKEPINWRKVHEIQNRP